MMAKLKVPIIAIVIGEGSSGGALAIGVANKVIMLENAIYSILSPEGYNFAPFSYADFAIPYAILHLFLIPIINIFLSFNNISIPPIIL